VSLPAYSLGVVAVLFFDVAKVQTQSRREKGLPERQRGRERERENIEMLSIELLQRLASYFAAEGCTVLYRIWALLTAAGHTERN
jgi:hypothetical protein